MLFGFFGVGLYFVLLWLNFFLMISGLGWICMKLICLIVMLYVFYGLFGIFVMICFDYFYFLFNSKSFIFVC